jgi:hypothetical protein
MPNFEYDTRTPDEKKKLMRGMLNIEVENADQEDTPQETDSTADDGRGPMHRHQS